MSWRIGEVIDETFKVFGKNWKTLVLGNFVVSAIVVAPLLLWGAIVIPPLIAKGVFDGSGNNLGPLLEGGVVGTMLAAFLSTLVLAILFGPAMTRIALAAVRNEQPRVGDVFTFRRVGSFFGAGLLVGLIVGGCSLLLFVPGIIAALGLAFVSFYVIDERGPKDATDALEASWNAMKGHKARLFGLALLFFLVTWVIGAIAELTLVLLPLRIALGLVQTPIMIVGLAIIYTKINPQQSGAQQLAA